MPELNQLYKQMIEAFEVPGIEIPTTAVKIFNDQDKQIKSVLKYMDTKKSITSCQATRIAAKGDPILLTKDNIGCVAAAISFGLVREDDPVPLEGRRVYTDIMEKQAVNKERLPPSPKDFTDGTVYACKYADRMEFALFGEEDAGRFKDVETAKKAINQMATIRPADTKGVFFFSEKFDSLNIEPDVVLMDIRPVELSRIVQAYHYMTGDPIRPSMGGLRAINSDLIVLPYLTQEINLSPYCLGARILAEFDHDRLGIGIPYEKFKIIVQGMEESSGGYPFYLYPGAIAGK